MFSKRLKSASVVSSNFFATAHGMQRQATKSTHSGGLQRRRTRNARAAQEDVNLVCA